MEILSAFQGMIEPVRASTAYKLGILLAAAVMVLLPLIYLGTIVLVCYLVYLHAVHGISLIGVGAGRPRGGYLMLYLAPLVAGVILVLFMIKPLFARSAKDFKKRALSPDQQPALFAFVERVCTVVGAPVPKRIEVDCQVNASASFRRGLWSILGNDLVLTLGLPLVAGLTLRQFAGVLAHEFGHFSQGAGMRLTYLVRSVNWWLTRAVYERDVWDDRLVEWAQGGKNYLAPALQLARLCVWLTRRILWALMMLGHAAAGFMLRQMEFEADRYEARLAGSDTFEATARQLTVLNVANQGAQADLSEFFREGRLGDDLPRLIQINAARLPAVVYTKIDEMIEKSSTGLLDSHPCDRDRIQSARRENAPGVFHLQYPAAILFRDFPQLSKDVTGDYYRAVLGRAFRVSSVHPLDELLAGQGKNIEGDKAMDRYFLGCFHVLRPLALPSIGLTEPRKPDVLKSHLQEARGRMVEAKPAYDEAYAVFDQCDTRILETYRAWAILHANLKIKPGEFSVPMATIMACHEERNRALMRQGRVTRDLLRLEEAAADRLAAALELFTVPEVSEKIEQPAERRQECERLLPALGTVSSELGRALELRNEQAVLEALLSRLDDNRGKEDLIGAIVDQMGIVRTRAIKIRETLCGIDYPFEHAEGRISIGEYALPRVPASDHVGEVFEAGQAVLQAMPSLYARMMGRLVATAELVEQALGLPQLEAAPAPCVCRGRSA